MICFDPREVFASLLSCLTINQDKTFLFNRQERAPFSEHHWGHPILVTLAVATEELMKLCLEILVLTWLSVYRGNGQDTHWFCWGLYADGAPDSCQWSSYSQIRFILEASGFIALQKNGFRWPSEYHCQWYRGPWPPLRWPFQHCLIFLSKAALSCLWMPNRQDRIFPGKISSL